MKIFIKLLITAILFTQASTAHALPPQKEYENISEIPDALRSHLLIKKNQYIETYIASVLQLIREFASDRQAITVEEIKKAQEQHTKNKKRKVIKNILDFDENGDGKITRDEIGEKLTLDTQERLQKSTITPWGEYDKNLWVKVDNVMKHDKNNDGTITVEEIEIDSNHRDETETHLAHLTELIKGEELSLKELEEMARASFNTADANRNGILESDEHKALQEERRKTQNSK